MPICPHCETEFSVHSDYVTEDEKIQNEKNLEEWKRVISRQKRFPRLAFLSLIFIAYLIGSSLSLGSFNPYDLLYWNGFETGVLSVVLLNLTYSFIKMRKRLKEVIPLLHSQGYEI